MLIECCLTHDKAHFWPHYMLLLPPLSIRYKMKYPPPPTTNTRILELYLYLRGTREVNTTRANSFRCFYKSPERVSQPSQQSPQVVPHLLGSRTTYRHVFVPLPVAPDDVVSLGLESSREVGGDESAGSGDADLEFLLRPVRLEGELRQLARYHRRHRDLLLYIV